MQKKKTAKTGMGIRLRAWRKSMSIKGYKFAKMIRISQGSLSDIENNKSDPSAETIVKILTRTDIDWRWLLTGEYGSLEKGQRPKKAKARVIIINPGSELVIKVG